MLGDGQIPNRAMKEARGYVCHRAPEHFEIDGRIDKAVWEAAAWTEDFVDILGDRGPRPRFRTRAKMLWDDEFFYVAAELEEPQVSASLTEKNSILFHDNDFEVFIDPDGDNLDYYEFEVNALNTIWELSLPRPYRAGGPARLGTNLEGLRSAVWIDGTLNDPSDTDRRWCVEIAFPFAELAAYAGDARSTPPDDGDEWRVSFSRVEWLYDIIDGTYRKVPHRDEDNWLWTPQPAVDMHRPWTWGRVIFSTAPAGSVAVPPDGAWSVKMLLMDIYDAQRTQNLPADDLATLGIDPGGTRGLVGDVIVERTPEGWRARASARLTDGRVQHWCTRQDSRLWQEGEESPEHSA